VTAVIKRRKQFPKTIIFLSFFLKKKRKMNVIVFGKRKRKFLWPASAEAYHGHNFPFSCFSSF